MTGDCGSNTVIFASICQANNVPCIIQPGRWALNETPGYGQFHVNCSLYDESVGLVPVDATFGVLNYKAGDTYTRWFGRNEGKFITFGTGATFYPENGRDNHLGQFMIISKVGGSSPYRPTYTDRWYIR